MPVIRLTATATVFKREDREAMLAQLEQEITGEVTEGGPVIFEIPLTGTDKFDALVIWNKWKDKDVASQTRSEMILTAYQDKKDKIAQALGVTYKEAIDQNLLPYAVVPMVRKSEVSRDQLISAMRRYGGFPTEGDRVELRLPTMEIAREVHQKLVDELPKGYWSIVQTPDRID